MKYVQKQIIVPLDGSATSEEILPYAATLASVTDSRLTLLRVVPPVSMIEPLAGMLYPGDAYWEAMGEEPSRARKYLEDIAIRPELSARGLVIETRVLAGDPATSIVDYVAKQDNARYVAMVTHSRNAVGRVLFGSVAEHVLRHSPVPVLMFHHKNGAKTPLAKKNDFLVHRSILVPLDGSGLSDEAVEHARAIAADIEGTLVLLSVADDPGTIMLLQNGASPLWLESLGNEHSKQLEQHLYAISDRLAEARIRVKSRVEFGDPADKIIEASAEPEVGLIVMSTHGRSGLQRMWLGSVAMKVVQASNKPVLLIRSGIVPEGAEEHKRMVPAAV